jgi:trigger factor
VKTTVEPLEGNKVKLSIEVDEHEFDRAIDAAFKRIAREVRLPGFRPGKAPRRILEAKLGVDVGREEALRGSLPEYYSQAVIDHDIDVIAAPEIEIVAGKEDGPVAFDAVVEVRPTAGIGGYQGLRVELPAFEATDEEIDNQVNRLRAQFAELAPVDRPAEDHDHVTVDIVGSRDGEPLPGLEAEGYMYEVGTGGIAPEVDENLRGASVGDVLEFQAVPAQEDQEPVDFRIEVHQVQAKDLPEPTDEWAAEVSEFETIEALRTDLASRISNVRRIQAQMALRDKAVLALVELVELEVPEPLVNHEVQQRLEDLAMRLQAQGMSAQDYLMATGQSQEDLVSELRTAAVQNVKADLALRALADAEDLQADDDELEAEIVSVADRLGEKPNRVRKQFERGGQLTAVRSDIRKRKALDWLVEHVELVDENGQPIDRDALALPNQADDDDEVDDDAVEIEGAHEENTEQDVD